MLADEPGGVADKGNRSRLQTRQNAALTLLMTCTKIKEASLLDSVVDAMASCTNDQDRYVMVRCPNCMRVESQLLLSVRALCSDALLVQIMRRLLCGILIAMIVGLLLRGHSSD